MNENKTNINWYPGHMAKTKREVVEKLDLIDIVFEVIDARIPYSSKNKDIDNMVKNKKRIIVMTKIDLCDVEVTKKWINYYEELGFKVITVDLINNKNIKEILEVTNNISNELNEKRKLKGLKPRKTRILILGIPNVGKSTLINSLVGKKATSVGNKPGVTKHLEWIRINDKLELLDTPGILWPKLDNEKIALNLASMTAIKEEILPIDDVAIYILSTLDKYYKDKLKERYGIEKVNNDDIVETLDLIGKKRGCIIGGNEVDYDRVYNLIINDIKSGNLKGITFDMFE